MFQKFMTAAILCATSFTFSVEAKDTTPATQVGKPIVLGQEISLFSKVLNEQRTLLVHLPRGYETDTERDYPVLVTLDGQTHFKHMSGTVDWLSNQTGRIPRMIVVALTNTQRGRDMTASHNGGGGDKFVEFIANELMPYIDNKYRTRSFKILAGHSMAGHLTLNVLNQAPELFNAYVAMSPWFHQDRGETKLGELLADKIGKKPYDSKFVYVSIGDEQRLRPMYDAFVKVLKLKAHSKLDWHSKVSGKDNHMSIPSNTMNEALQFIFEKQRLSPDSEVAQGGIESIKQYYQTISKEKYGYDISPEGAINRLGYHWLWQGNTEKAIEIFEANVKEFPGSPNTYESLAEAYQDNKQFELALTTIAKGIKIGEAANSNEVRWLKRREQRIKEAMQGE